VVFSKVFEKDINNLCLFELVSNMKISLYLPQDYVVQKDDYGNEMFFILEGYLNCLTMNERQVLL